MKTKPKISKPVISQAQLARYVTLKRQEDELENLKLLLIANLENGGKIEDGKLTAHLNIGSTSNVKWREEFVRLRSEKEANEIVWNAPKIPVRTLKVFDRLVD